MAQADTSGAASVVLLGGGLGVTLIPSATPLARLNYFDGKFLRASDFAREQDYLRRLVAISNQGLGSGVVYGYDVQVSGDSLKLGAGLAIAPSGEVLLLPQAATLDLPALIDASRARQAESSSALPAANAGFSDCVEVIAPPTASLLPTSDLWVITICHAEALCGQEDVFGKLCEVACVTSTDRPLKLEGVVVRALPLPLVTPFPTSKVVAIDDIKYLRSKVASSFFADEVLKHPSAISRDGLLGGPWCLGSGYDSSCCEVPLAVVGRAGQTTTFYDAWIARRERIDPPARRYWQWKMMMRPWDVLLAQVLQFQCQLADALHGLGATSAPVDPCMGSRSALGEAARLIEELSRKLSSSTPVFSTDASAASSLGQLSTVLSQTRLDGLKSLIEGALQSSVPDKKPTARVLISLGLLSTPPAGWLPIDPQSSVPVNTQVRALFGEGVDLRFCVVRPDFVAHAFEEAQHMDRISLIEGLDDPQKKPKVDVLVPDGIVLDAGVSPDAELFSATFQGSTAQTGGLFYKGSARQERLEGGGGALYSAGAGVSQDLIKVVGTMLQTARAPEAAPAAVPASAAAPASNLGDASTLTPNFEANAFARLDPTRSFAFAQTLAGVATAARARLATLAPIDVAGAAANELKADLNGYYLTLRNEAAFRDLDLFQQTPVSGRLLISHAVSDTSTTPPSTSFQAFELAFNGTFTLTEAPSAGQSGAVVLKGVFNLVFTLGLLRDPSAGNQEQDLLLLTKTTLNATVSYADSGADESTQLDLVSAQASSSSTIIPALRFTRRFTPSLSRVLHEIFVLAVVNGNQVSAKFAELDLRADSDVVKPSSEAHRLAESGLDVVQAAMKLSEPSFKKGVEPKLFPLLPPSSVELSVKARYDWVLFHRRREKVCSAVAAPAPLLPQRYRIYNFTAPSLAEAKKLVETMAGNPSLLIGVVRQAASKQDQTGLNLVIEFTGGTSEPRFTFSAAEQDWKRFAPGDNIVFVAYGARGNDDAALENERLRQFESAIASDSKESAQTREVPLVPFPIELELPDADGIMFFITVASTVAVDSHHVFGVPNLDTFQSLLSLIDAGALIPATGGTSILDRLDDLGIAEFQSGTNVLAGAKDDAVVQAFRAKYPNATVAAALSLARSAASQTQRDTFTAQTKQIEGDLGGSANVNSKVYVAELPTSSAVAISFFVPKQVTKLRTARVLAERSPDTILDTKLQFDANGPATGTELDNALKSMKAGVEKFGLMNLFEILPPVGADPDPSNVDATALLKLLDKAGFLVPGLSPVTVPPRPDDVPLLQGVDEVIRIGWFVIN